jgi:ComF family protein
MIALKSGTCLHCQQKGIGMISIICEPCFLQLPWCLKPYHMLKGLNCFSALRYQKPITQWIYHFKYQADWTLARLFAQCITKHPHSLFTDLPQALCIMPLHPEKLQSRGFNQSYEIARLIAKTWHIPILTDQVSRIKKTKPQHRLTPSQRTKNLISAFDAQPLPDYIKHLGIIDDLITTGASAKAVCNIIQQVTSHPIEFTIFTAAVSISQTLQIPGQVISQQRIKRFKLHS